MGNERHKSRDQGLDTTFLLIRLTETCGTQATTTTSQLLFHLKSHLRFAGSGDKEVNRRITLSFIQQTMDIFESSRSLPNGLEVPEQGLTLVYSTEKYIVSLINGDPLGEFPLENREL